MHERWVDTSDGRKLKILEADASGFPVFSLHGNPGSRLLYRPHVDDARSRGIRLIGYDRPGYGGSTPAPERRVGDAAADVAAIADALGIDTFAVWGHSGGGPPALACAALLPKRVVATVSMASHAPYPTEGADWYDGMGEFNVEDIRLMLADRGAWEAKLEQDWKGLLEVTPGGLESAFSTLLSDRDRSALDPELLRFFTEEIHEGIRAGSAGWRDDSLQELKDWGFDLRSIRVPVQIWHGRHDRFAPFAHGSWLVSQIPGVDAQLRSDEGHITLFKHRVPDAHRWLLSKR